ncbi:MAG: hypothetical protein Ct9H300mP2_2230 [Candidatus Neomarinimicrobiota bacterium]|nr:MAG: hypothetical protein Ct9H300mP2_2230 [Candidatus Neomarinimicrobiota bacterium]
MAQFSTELNTLKVSVFDVDKDYQKIITEVLQLGNARGSLRKGFNPLITAWKTRIRAIGTVCDR